MKDVRINPWTAVAVAGMLAWTMMEARAQRYVSTADSLHPIPFNSL